jgi:hypothetical protein
MLFVTRLVGCMHWYSTLVSRTPALSRKCPESRLRISGSRLWATGTQGPGFIEPAARGPEPGAKSIPDFVRSPALVSVWLSHDHHVLIELN